MSKSKQVAMYQKHPNAEVRLKETWQLCMEISREATPDPITTT